MIKLGPLFLRPKRTDQVGAYGCRMQKLLGSAARTSPSLHATRMPNLNGCIESVNPEQSLVHRHLTQGSCSFLLFFLQLGAANLIRLGTKVDDIRI